MSSLRWRARAAGRLRHAYTASLVSPQARLARRLFVHDEAFEQLAGARRELAQAIEQLHSASRERRALELPPDVARPSSVSSSVSSGTSVHGSVGAAEMDAIRATPPPAEPHEWEAPRRVPRAQALRVFFEQRHEHS